MIRLDVNDERVQGKVRLSASRLVSIEHALNRVLNGKRERRISVAFISEREMKQLNWHHRGKRGVTDVLSFTLQNEDYYGEVLLSYEQAVRQAKQMRHSIRDEIVFLLVHGVLHVFGFDHEMSSDAKKMFSLQTQILLSLDVDPRV